MENTDKKILNSYLTFALGNETFASNVSKVLNILELTKITKVPKTPSYMKGVINLRGTVLPVIEARLKFGMASTDYTHNTCILVLEVEIKDQLVQVGAIVDSVKEVLEIDTDTIQPPPSIGSKYKSEFIYGMAKHKDEFIMLVDMDKVFTMDEIIDLKGKTADKSMATLAG